MWVGERFYTPQSFILEAEKMGVSKLVATIPKGLEIGKTKVLLAHKKAWMDKEPGIFYAFVVRRIEVLVREEDLEKDWVERLRRRGVTIIIVNKGRGKKYVQERLVLEVS